ncbi:hypothetical protein DLH72_03565 [Candidatus Gracilibacteria bacterium]|nr:MAG: hypothetical protein DLH72_03565 [Candidatus Gracilibacteria bacterium]
MKTIRTGVYALLKYKENIVVILKKRGPFTGLYDLPGGKIEHGENSIFSLKRELEEEIGLSEKDFEIKKLLTVEEDFVKHIWEGKEKDEHIIAIVYEVEILKKNLDFDFIEKGGDSAGIKLISINDINFPKTNILNKVLKNYKAGKFPSHL